MRLVGALSIANYQVDIFPYALASAYSFCDGVAIVYSSPFPNKDVVDKIKYYIGKFPDHDKKITFDQIDWVYPDTQAARERGHKTSSDQRFVGIAGPETQSLFNAMYFKPDKIVYMAGDQIFYEHWLNIREWLDYHWQIGNIIRCHLVDFCGPNLLNISIDDPLKYLKIIKRNPNMETQCAIVEPGICCMGNEGAICDNGIPCETQPVIRTFVEAHFREWSPLSNLDDIYYQRMLTRVHIRNFNNEYEHLLSSDDEIKLAKDTNKPNIRGVRVGSTPHELYTPPNMPSWMNSKEPWSLLSQSDELRSSAWIPKL